MGIVKRVVLLGPCHRVAVRGLALPEATAFETPLGRVEVDAAAVAALKGLPQVSVNAATHAQEHSLEVQLPFLQQVLKGFKVVPLVVGQATGAEVAAVLDRLWGGPETLIVISSDLSHYHPYDTARAIDRKTVQAIVGFRTDIDHVQACGATPMTGFLETAKRRGMTPELLDARNSGDTAGGRDRVVGYASFAFWDQRADYQEEHGRTLLGLARASVANALQASAETAIPDLPWLKERRATFVTLMQDARLRGCIGSLQPTRALGDDVVANAAAAALARPALLAARTGRPRAGGDGGVAALGADRGALRRRGRARRGASPRRRRPDPGERRQARHLPAAGMGADPGTEAVPREPHAEGRASRPTPGSTRCQVWRYQVRKWKESELP